MHTNIFLRPMAYLDPGTGSLIIQLVLAGLLGVGLAARIFWKKIVSLFNKDQGKDDLEELDELDEYGDNIN